MISAQGVAVVLEARGAARDRESWVGRRVVAVCSAAGTEFRLDAVAVLGDVEDFATPLAVDVVISTAVQTICCAALAVSLTEFAAQNIVASFVITKDLG